jgi:hypothetical protein
MRKLGMDAADQNAEDRWKRMRRMGFTRYVALETVVLLCIVQFFDLLVRHIAIFTFDNIFPSVVAVMILAIFRWRRAEEEAGDFPFTLRRRRSENEANSVTSHSTEGR